MTKTAELRERLVKLGYPGILALFDFIESERKAGRVIVKIGSANIDLFGKVAELEARPHKKEEMLRLRMALPAHHFGRIDGGRTPIEDLMDFAEAVANRSSDEIEKLDRLCLDLTLEDGDFKVIHGKSILYRPTH